MKTILVPIIALAFLFNCRSHKDLTEQDSMSIRIEVRQMLSAMSDSIRTQGLIGWLPFLHKSPDFSWEFHGQKASYDSIEASERREGPLFRSISLVWDSIQVQPVTFDKATLFATYHETVIDTTGRKSMLTGSVEANLIKVSNSWKVQNGRTFAESTTEIR